MTVTRQLRSEFGVRLRTPISKQFRGSIQQQPIAFHKPFVSTSAPAILRVLEPSSSIGSGCPPQARRFPAAAARIIVNDVARRGDEALKDYTRKFDKLDLDRAAMRVTADEIGAAVKACSRETLDALELARGRIETYHRRQLQKDDRITDAL